MTSFTYRTIRHYCAVLVLLCAGFRMAVAQQSAPTVTQAEQSYSFYTRGPYRSTIPKPSAILGYEAGERHSTFRDQERVLFAIAAAAKDRVRIVDYGKSVEGRPLRLVLVSAPENMARLETIRTQIARLSDPRMLDSPAEVDNIGRTTPVITWINHCIHGDETASFESMMWTLYTLAASQSPQIEETLRNSVIILNPVFNPDGHERFVVYYNSVAVGSPEEFAYEQREPWAVVGRFNHYRFDMNRDKLAQSQPEVRQETAAFLHWHPQVYADEHGQPSTYFFPPNAQPANSNVDRARLEKWTDRFGRANGEAFDRYGWPYVTRETFDFFYPGYLDSWSTLAGAIGMTYETDGGGDLARRRSDGTVSTLRDGIAHHFETSLATIMTAARNREALLRDFYAYRREAIQAGKTGRMRRIVLLPGADPNRAAELAELLLRSGIEVREATAPFASASTHAYLPAAASQSSATARRFPAGALIVDLAQPQGRMACAFLEPDPDFEPEFVKEQLARRARNEQRNDNESKEEYSFYDITAWSLPYTYGLEAYWTEDAPDVSVRALAPDSQGQVTLRSQSGGVQGGKARVAYLFRYDRDAAATFALRLLQESYRLAVAGKPVRAGGKEWPRGTLVAFVSRNPESLHSRIQALSKRLGVDVYALNSDYGDTSSVTLGSDSVVSVKRPHVAVVVDDMVSHTSYGELWYLFEQQIGLEFTPIRLNSLRSGDLDRFNIVIFPDGYGYSSALGKSGVDALKEWIGRGNVLVGLGGGGQWFTDKEASLSSAVPVGQEERPAGGQPQSGEKPKPKQPEDLPGAIFRAQIDSTHFLGYGYPGGEIAVPLSGSAFLKPSKQGANVVRFGKGPSRLSGFVWPGNTEELLANTVYVVDEPIGSGHAILYLNDPLFRALWPGLRRCFLSSLLFGPARTALRPDDQ